MGPENQRETGYNDDVSAARTAYGYDLLLQPRSSSLSFMVCVELTLALQMPLAAVREGPSRTQLRSPKFLYQVVAWAVGAMRARARVERTAIFILMSSTVKMSS